MIVASNRIGNIVADVVDRFNDIPLLDGGRKRCRNIALWAGGVGGKHVHDSTNRSNGHDASEKAKPPQEVFTDMPLEVYKFDINFQKVKLPDDFNKLHWNFRSVADRSQALSADRKRRASGTLN